MNVAVLCNGLSVASDVNHCTGLMCYRVDRGIVSAVKYLPRTFSLDKGLIAIADELDFDAVICGDMNSQLCDDFVDEGIEVILGVTGLALDAVSDYVSTLTDVDRLDEHVDEEATESDVDAAFEVIARNLGASA